MPVILFVLACILMGSGNDPAAQQNLEKGKAKWPTTHYTVTKAVSKIKVDGVLSEAAWENAVVMEIPYEYFPGENIPAPVKTECLVTFSESKLYFGFRCFDPDPKKIRAHLMDRDAMDTFVMDDHIILMLDTFNDERRAFQFRVNPLGVQADASFSEMEGYEDFSWDCIWDSAGKITGSGYVVEVAIPFNQLRFPRTMEKKTWGFSIDRTYPRSTRHRLKSHPIDRNRMCLLCQANKVTGFEGISPGRNLEFDPTLTSYRTDKQTDFPDGELETGKLKIEPGISARWGLTPNMILNATVNPDFSQVEADVAQLEENTRFALQYPEKRPFFLEGADFFLTPLDAVFTRTVYDPLWGVKITGKAGRNAIGFFSAQDSYNNLLFPSNQGSWSTSLKEDVYSGVLRYRRDMGKGSTLGFLYTGRVSDEYYNHVFGVDGFFRLTPTKTVNFQYLRSQTDYPDDIAAQNYQQTGNFGGNAFLASVMHGSRGLEYGALYRELSDQFRADSGFVPRVNMRHYRAYFQPILWGKTGSWFHQFVFCIQADRFTDTDGKLTDQDIMLYTTYQGPLQTMISPAFSFQKEWYNGVTYDKKLFKNLAEIRPFGGFRFSLYTAIGDAIDYSNSRLAHSIVMQPTVDFSVGKHVNVSLIHTLQRLSLEGKKIYDVNLTQAKIVYNFNVRTLFRVILQYMDLRRNTDLYISPVAPVVKTLFTQLLFSYKVNPQTKIFLGYSDDHMGLRGIDIGSTNRTFFLKVGYAIVL
ncbi:MAG: carbohydrate binding family 9 domain-containing protein [bacterium]|nr:carbohydrate binding family 9 domain-containing protein [bacterium]